MLSKFLQNPELFSYGDGHEAASTEGFNTDDPVLLMADGDDLEMPSDVPQDLPQHITIRTRIEGVPLTQKRTQVQSQINEDVYPAHPLYAAALEDKIQQEISRFGQHKSVRLMSTGLMMGADQGSFYSAIPSSYKLSLGEEEPVFEKAFVVQTAAQLAQRKRYVDPYWVTTPAGQNEGQSCIIPAYGFGGFYKPGATPVEQIAQVYFIITQDADKSMPQMQTTGFWQAKKCAPPNGGMIDNIDRGIFMDPLSESQCRSLAGDLQAGSATVTLTNDQEETFTYKSIGHTQKEIASPLLDVHLTLMKNGDNQ